jgi:N-acetylglucosaminyl-diphospho-decaprenol L-rhamnosyltransferase
VPEADVVAGTENLGFAGGVNRLLARSDAPWFVTLNSDAWPMSGALAQLVRTAEAHPRAALVAPRLEREDGRLEHSTHRFPSVGLAAFLAVGAQRAAPQRAERLLIEGFWDHDRLREVDWAVGACWLMRRAAVEDVGGLDEQFFMYAEDLEWCHRARRGGWEIWFDPAARVVHLGNASGAQRLDREVDRTTAYLRNTYRFYRQAHGVAREVAYRACNLLGAARLYLLYRRRGVGDRAAYWKQLCRVHVQPAGHDR